MKYLETKVFRLGRRQIRQQHIELGRPVLRHTRTSQRLVVRQCIYTVWARTVHEPLPTHIQLAVGGKHALLDAENSVGGRHVIDGDGGAGHGDDGDATEMVEGVC